MHSKLPSCRPRSAGSLHPGRCRGKGLAGLFVPGQGLPRRYPQPTMLGIHARPQINRVIEPTAPRLAALGVTPDALTVIGTIGVAGGALGFYRAASSSSERWSSRRSSSAI